MTLCQATNEPQLCPELFSLRRSSGQPSRSLPRLPFPFIDLRIAHPATPVFSQPSALPGCSSGPLSQRSDLRPSDLQLFSPQGAAASYPSLSSESHPRFLYFQQLADSFAKPRGWAASLTSPQGSSALELSERSPSQASELCYNRRIGWPHAGYQFTPPGNRP
jgi:hypothetical protein